LVGCMVCEARATGAALALLSLLTRASWGNG